MDNDNVKWLTTVPATDGNFKNHLHMATDEEIERSINRTLGRKGNASRIKVLQRELKIRARKRRVRNESVRDCTKN